jgi:hypothetical protein
MDFLADHAAPAAVFYRGPPGLRGVQIRADEVLRDGIADFLVKGNLPESPSPLTMHKAIRSFVTEETALNKALGSGEAPGPSLSLAARAGIIALGLVLAPVLGLWMLLIRILEISESGEPAMGPHPDRAECFERRKILDREDLIAQNQHTHVVEIKPGWLRAATLRTVLFGVNFAGRRVYNRGSLGGVSSLHFVSWVIIDGGRRLLFLSDYDGSTLKYVGDFVDRSRKIAPALTGMWSNTLGFPETRWLFGKGARNLPLFLAFLRDYQQHAQVWYSAYEHLTTKNILNNREIRSGLAGGLSERDAQRWLQRL